MNGHSQWDKLRYLHPDEGAWGSSHKMDKYFLNVLDDFCELIKERCVVIDGYRENNGFFLGDAAHTVGKAAKIVAPKFAGHLLDLYLEATRLPFHGIGIYRDFTYGTEKLGGLHIDTYQPEGWSIPHKRWICVNLRKGLDQYVEITVDNLKAFGILK